MPSVSNRVFAGIRPAITERNLEPRYAQRAHNTRLRDGSLQPFLAPKLVDSAAYPIRSIYQTRDNPDCCAKILTWDHCTSVIEPTDPGCHGFGGIVVFHNDGDCTEPQRYFPCEDTWYPLVVPQPTSPLAAQRVAAGQLEQEVAAMGEVSGRGPDERSYTYTWVDRFGVESPPAYPSAPVFAYDDEVWRLSGFYSPPSNAVCVRIYRTSSTFEDGTKVANPFDTSFQLVEEVPVGAGATWAGVYIDSRRLIDMDHGTLLTEDDCPPPCMDQVVMTEQGYGVGFKGNELFVSERNEPHNWPEKYRHTLPDKIVAIANFYDWVFIGTTGAPYRMKVVWTKMGDESDTQVDILPYKEVYPCLSQRAFVATNFGAMYGTYKGLVQLFPDSNAVLVSRQREDEDDWYHDRAPNTAAYVNGKYFGARVPSGNAFVFDVQERAEGALDLGDFVTVDWTPHSVHVGRRGQLLFSTGNNLYEWNASVSRMVYVWRSKRFRLAGHVAMSAAKVVGDYGPPVLFRVWRDGKLYYERQVNHSNPFRLPPAGRGLEWEFEVTGSSQVYEVHISTSFGELVEEIRD